MEKDENNITQMKYEEYIDSPFEKEMIETAEQAYIESPPDLDKIYEDIINSKTHYYKVTGEVKSVRGTTDGVYIEAIQRDEESEQRSFYTQLTASFIAQYNIGIIKAGDKFIFCFTYLMDETNLIPVVYKKL